MNCILIPDALQILNVQIPRVDNRIDVRKEQNRFELRSNFKCCDKFYADLGSFAVHFRSNHQKLCLGKFSQKRANHRRAHPPPFHCQFCSKLFSNHLHKSKHERAVHREIVEKSKQFQCRFCSRGFDLASNLATHEKNHQDGELTCKLCKKSFTHIHKRRNHEKKYHRLNTQEVETIKFTCDICQGTFSRKDSLLRHITKHLNQNQVNSKHFICEICAKMFDFLENLKLHMRQVHQRKSQPQTLVLCDICNLTLKNINSLRVHRKNVHEVTSPLFKSNLTFIESPDPNLHENQSFNCNICGKSFKNLHSCRLHELRHTKIMECRYCNTQIVGKHKLEIHEKRHLNKIGKMNLESEIKYLDENVGNEIEVQ